MRRKGGNREDVYSVGLYRQENTNVDHLPEPNPLFESSKRAFPRMRSLIGANMDTEILAVCRDSKISPTGSPIHQRGMNVHFMVFVRLDDPGFRVIDVKPRKSFIFVKYRIHLIRELQVRENHGEVFRIGSSTAFRKQTM